MLLPSLPSTTACLLAFLPLTYADTHNYDFDIGWVRANPDGEFERPVIGINGAWPIPVCPILDCSLPKNAIFPDLTDVAFLR